MGLRIAIAGWIGSDNLGDELILKCMGTALKAHQATPVAISINPIETRATHGLEVFAHRSPRDSRALARGLATVDGMIFGGGGLIQDETSPWNIPFHTSRIRSATRAGVPTIALGLGVGAVSGRIGRRMTRRALVSLGAIVVRDEASAANLSERGLPGSLVGADPVIGATIRTQAPTDTICLVLRRANRPGLRTAAATSPGPDPKEVAGIARAVDGLAASTGLGVRMVVFHKSRDDMWHRAVAERLTVPTELVVPHLGSVLDEVGKSKLVVTMRYHGAIAALLHQRPTVLLDYSPKMASLAAESGGWAATVDPNNLTAPILIAAAASARERAARIPEARHGLEARLAINQRVLDEFLATVS